MYAASKRYMRGFAHSVEAHAGQEGAALTLINPTAIRTQMWADELVLGKAAESEEVTAQVVNAATQPSHTTLSEIDLFRRNMLGMLVPQDVDLDVSYEE